MREREESRQSMGHLRVSERMITKQEEGRGAEQEKCAPFGREGRRENEHQNGKTRIEYIVDGSPLSAAREMGAFWGFGVSQESLSTLD